MNKCAKTEELLDASLAVRSVAYEMKLGHYFFKELYVIMYFFLLLKYST
jgi:hypothetical protein